MDAKDRLRTGKKITTSIILSENLWNAAREAGKQKGLNRSLFIREVLIDHLVNNHRPLEIIGQVRTATPYAQATDPSIYAQNTMSPPLTGDGIDPILGG